MGNREERDCRQPFNLAPLKRQMRDLGFKLLFRIGGFNSRTYVMGDAKGLYRNDVLRVCDMELGVLSKKMKESVLLKALRTPATFYNILYELNTKLGGENHRVKSENFSGVLSVPGEQHAAPFLVIGVAYGKAKARKGRQTAKLHAVMMAATADSNGFRHLADYRRGPTLNNHLNAPEP